MDDCETLLEVLVREAKHSRSPGGVHSLAHVTKFEANTRVNVSGGVADLNKAVPFLALPHVRSFRTKRSTAGYYYNRLCVPRDLYRQYGQNLEIVRFDECNVDKESIAEFLKHTPRLRVLKYSHSGIIPRFDICGFVTAIERGVGAHLEQLSIRTLSQAHWAYPGTALMRGFQRLQKLELPFQFPMHNIDGVIYPVPREEGSLENGIKKEAEPFICDIVPPSVSELSLVRGLWGCRQVLNAMFDDLAAIKDSKLPALKKVYISGFPSYSGGRVNDFREDCDRAVAEAEKAGVVLHFCDRTERPNITWEEEDNYAAFI